MAGHVMHMRACALYNPRGGFAAEEYGEECFLGGHLALLFFVKIEGLSSLWNPD
jgi:hypothetical protein